MPKTTTGRAFQRGGVWWCDLRLPGKRRVRRPLPAPASGRPYTEADAALVAAWLRSEYLAGRDPFATPRDVAPLETGPTFYQHVHAFAARQTYESAPKELRAVELYLAGCPLAPLPVCDVRARHGVQLLTYLKALPSRRGGTLGRSPVVSVFNVCERALDELLAAEVFAANPFRATAVHKHLPKKRDKVPGARARWRFPVAHIRALTTDTRVLPDRRVVNGMLFWTGLRPGEYRAARVYDLDLEARPLGCLSLARAIKSVSGDEGETKTGAIKLVPILPPLAELLRWWLAVGWREVMGRDPKPDDLLFPTVRGKHRHRGLPRDPSAANRAFKDDQRALQLSPVLHQYAARHTFVRMLRDAGASRDVVRWATHAPPASVYDGYADAPPWDVLCVEFAKLLPFVAPAWGHTEGTIDPTATRHPIETLLESWRKHRGIEASENVGEVSNRRESAGSGGGGPERLVTPHNINPRGEGTAVPRGEVYAYALADHQLAADLEAELAALDVTAPGGDA